MFVNKHARGDRPMPDGRDIIDEYEKSNTAQADVVDEDHLDFKGDIVALK